MSSPNGTTSNGSAHGIAAPRRTVIELGDLSPETVPVTITRDGRVVELVAYVRGDRTMLNRALAVSAAWRGVLDSMKVRDEDGALVLDADGNPTYHPDEDGVRWFMVLAAMLREVIRTREDEPGLTLEESITLAYNGGRGERMLRGFGWLPPLEDGPDPEAAGGDASPTTGGASSPISASTSTAVEPTS
jgi:hypothetical protein